MDLVWSDKCDEGLRFDISVDEKGFGTVALIVESSNAALHFHNVGPSKLRQLREILKAVPEQGW